SAEVDAIEANAQQLLDLIPNYEALIVRSRTKVTAEVIGRGTKLRVIGRAGTGVDNIDVRAATARRISVVNAPTASTISVAELAIGHMISLARHLPEADRTMKDGNWEKKRFEGTELHDKVLGLLGSGRIGAEVAKRAHAFGMDVIAYDPYLLPKTAEERGIRLVSFEEILRDSDFLSVHAALTPETKAMIGPAQLRAMKRTAFLVNCARGEILQETALAKALADGVIAGAALDVFEKEPPTGSPILSTPNVAFTPHLGASTREAQARAGEIVVDEVLKALRGQKPEFAVNPEVYP
ncbi:MAG: hydroxyacid dehydrogenase, partial [Candidatus Thermoplasmatota archaeon]